MALTLTPQADGFRIFSESGSQLAQVQTCWADDDHKNHVVTWEPLPREQWTLRLNSASLTFVDLEALLDLLKAQGQ